MRVLALQLDQPADEPPAARTARALALLRAAGPADLVVLPELWQVGYFAPQSWAAAADAAPFPSLGPVADLARELDATVVAGSVVERSGDRLHNTAVVLGPDGGVLATYRKRHLFTYGSPESDLVEAGTQPVVVDTPAGRLGLAVCMDLRYPEDFAAARAAGADVHVVVAAWPAARTTHWQWLSRARAVDTQTPVVACNGAGPVAGARLAGCSAVVDARGTVLAEAGPDDVTVLTADLAHADTAAWRADFPLRPA